MMSKPAPPRRGAGPAARRWCRIRSAPARCRSSSRSRPASRRDIARPGEDPEFTGGGPRVADDEGTCRRQGGAAAAPWSRVRRVNFSPRAGLPGCCLFPSCRHRLLFSLNTSAHAVFIVAAGLCGRPGAGRQFGTSGSAKFSSMCHGFSPARNTQPVTISNPLAGLGEAGGAGERGESGLAHRLIVGDAGVQTCQRGRKAPFDSLILNAVRLSGTAPLSGLGIKVSEN